MSHDAGNPVLDEVAALRRELDETHRAWWTAAVDALVAFGHSRQDVDEIDAKDFAFMIGEEVKEAAKVEAERDEADGARILNAAAIMNALAERDAARERSAKLLDLAEMAWGVIANAADDAWKPGNWTDAARKWRDSYHVFLQEVSPRHDVAREPEPCHGRDPLDPPDVSCQRRAEHGGSCEPAPGEAARLDEAAQGPKPGTVVLDAGCRERIIEAIKKFGTGEDEAVEVADAVRAAIWGSCATCAPPNGDGHGHVMDRGPDGEPGGTPCPACSKSVSPSSASSEPKPDDPIIKLERWCNVCGVVYSYGPRSWQARYSSRPCPDCHPRKTTEGRAGNAADAVQREHDATPPGRHPGPLDAP